MKRSISALRFAFGRLDHQRAGDREAHRRRMESVVDQPLGDVVDGDLAGLLQRPQVDDAFVRDQAARSRIQHRVMRREPPGDVVRRQDRRLGRRPAGRRRPSSRCTSTRSAGCWRCRTAPPTPARCARRRASTLPCSVRWPGRKRARCAATATGPTPGPPPPCGMQKVLCRFRCETSAPNSPGARQPDQRVQVGAVDIDLAAVGVHDVADVPDAALRTRRASTDRSP